MAGTILISFNGKNELRVDYNGSVKSMFGFQDVELMKAVMTLESMFVTQTGIEISEMREIIDEERVASNIVDVEVTQAHGKENVIDEVSGD